MECVVALTVASPYKFSSSSLKSVGGVVEHQKPRLLRGVDQGYLLQTDRLLQLVLGVQSHSSSFENHFAAPSAAIYSSITPHTNRIRSQYVTSSPGMAVFCQCSLTLVLLASLGVLAVKGDSQLKESSVFNNARFVQPHGRLACPQTVQNKTSRKERRILNCLRQVAVLIAVLQLAAKCDKHQKAISTLHSNIESGRLLPT